MSIPLITSNIPPIAPVNIPAQGETATEIRNDSPLSSTFSWKDNRAGVERIRSAYDVDHTPVTPHAADTAIQPTQPVNAFSPLLLNFPHFQTPAFHLLLAMAEAHLESVEKLHQADLPFPTEKPDAYAHYAYIPSIDKNRPQVSIEYQEEILQLLAQLDDSSGNSVTVLSQGFFSGQHLSPKKVLEQCDSAPDPAKAKEEAFNDHYFILPADWKKRPLTGKEGIESKLSINVKQAYVKPLIKVLFDLSRSNIRTFSRSKVLGPAWHGLRTETADVYLSTTNASDVTKLSRYIHLKLLEKIGRHVEAKDLYLTPPPGTQDAQQSSVYSEKAANVCETISMGQERSRIVDEAVEVCRSEKKNLARALAEKLIENGYSPINPAFALRDNEDIDTVLEKGRILQDGILPSQSLALTASHSPQISAKELGLKELGLFLDHYFASRVNRASMRSITSTESPSAPTLTQIIKGIHPKYTLVKQTINLQVKEMEIAQAKLDDLEVDMFYDSEDAEDPSASENEVDRQVAYWESKLDKAQQKKQEKQAEADHLSAQWQSLTAICGLVAEKINAHTGIAVTPTACGGVLTLSCIQKNHAMPMHLAAALDTLLGKKPVKPIATDSIPKGEA